MSIEVIRQTLAALEHATPTTDWTHIIVALRDAIEQAQEPIAWVGPSWLHPETRTWESQSFAAKPIDGWIPLYTAPRQWQGLTDEEIDALWRDQSPYYDYQDLAHAIEAKLKKKNT